MSRQSNPLPLVQDIPQTLELDRELLRTVAGDTATVHSLWFVKGPEVDCQKTEQLPLETLKRLTGAYPAEPPSPHVPTSGVIPLGATSQPSGAGGTSVRSSQPAPRSSRTASNKVSAGTWGDRFQHWHRALAGSSRPKSAGLLLIAGLIVGGGGWYWMSAKATARQPTVQAAAREASTKAASFEGLATDNDLAHRVAQALSLAEQREKQQALRDDNLWQARGILLEAEALCQRAAAGLEACSNVELKREGIEQQISERWRDARFRIRQAQGIGNLQVALEATRQILRMIPYTEEPRHREAASLERQLESKIKRK